MNSDRKYIPHDSGVTPKIDGIRVMEITQAIMPPPTPSPLPRLDIKISEKYKSIIPPMPQAEYEALREDIKQHGLHVPLLVNQDGVLLDGHHRLRACDELGIKPHINIHASFANELEEEIFVYNINLERRHLNLAQRANLALEMQPKLAELAKRNMLAGKTLSRDQERVHVDKELAKKAKTSKDTIHKMRQIKQAAKVTPDKKLWADYDGRYRGKAGPTYAQLFNDTLEDKLTPSKAFSLIRHDKHILEQRAKLEAAAPSLGLPYKVTLLNADSTKFEHIDELKDNSIDLIVTDPPYLRENLPVYEGLARLAVQKLKPGGSLVFNYGNHLEIEIHKIFAKYSDKLTFWWRFCVYHEGTHAIRMHAYGVRVNWKPMMWFVKKGARRLTTYDINDYILSKKPDKDAHPWAQSSAEAAYCVKYLTESENSLVVDPFLGSGAYGIAAINLGRYFIGIEIDKDTFERARNYIISETATATPRPKEEEKEKEVL